MLLNNFGFDLIIDEFENAYGNLHENAISTVNSIDNPRESKYR